jgi:drug/metabolite transporter (DMT)-like permease
VLLNTLANLLFVRAVQLSPLSLTVPLLSLTPVFTTLMSLLIVHEVPTLQQTCGILFVVAGALSLHAGRESQTRLRGIWQAFTAERGSVRMTGVALLWSITAPLDKLATARSAVPVHALVQCGSMAVVLLLVLAGTRGYGDLRAVKGHVVPLVLAVVFGTAAVGLQFMAYQVMLVGLMEVIKRVIGLGSAIVLGYVLFDEALTRQKLCALCLMAAGLVLVLL